MRTWRIHFFTTYPYCDGTAGYYKWVRAWTKRGALRAGDFYRHRGWHMQAERWHGEKG